MAGLFTTISGNVSINTSFDGTAANLAARCVRIKIIHGRTRFSDPTPPSSCIMEFRNDDNLLDSLFYSSGGTGTFDPGITLGQAFNVNLVISGTEHRLFTGAARKVETVQHNKGHTSTVIVDCVDVLAQLAQQSISTSVTAQSQRARCLALMVAGGYTGGVTDGQTPAGVTGFTNNISDSFNLQARTSLEGQLLDLLRIAALPNSRNTRGNISATVPGANILVDHYNQAVLIDNGTGNPTDTLTIATSPSASMNATHYQRNTELALAVNSATCTIAGGTIDVGPVENTNSIDSHGLWEQNVGDLQVATVSQAETVLQAVVYADPSNTGTKKGTSQYQMLRVPLDNLSTADRIKLAKMTPVGTGSRVTATVYLSPTVFDTVTTYAHRIEHSWRVGKTWDAILTLAPDSAD